MKLSRKGLLLAALAMTLMIPLQAWAACDHQYGAWKTTKEPDCYQNGSQTRTCSLCGYNQFRIMLDSATGEHVYSTYTANSDGTETAKCTTSGCTATDTRCITHSYGAYAPHQDATCTKNATEAASCTRCGERTIREIANSALGHSFTSYVSDNNATCTTDGMETARCDRCAATNFRIIEGTKLGHDYATYVSNGDGTETATCTRCSQQYTRRTGTSQGVTTGTTQGSTEPTQERDTEKNTDKSSDTKPSVNQNAVGTQEEEGAEQPSVQTTDATGETLTTQQTEATEQTQATAEDKDTETKDTEMKKADHTGLIIGLVVAGVLVVAIVVVLVMYLRSKKNFKANEESK